jgi:hypothetical protein
MASYHHKAPVNVASSGRTMTVRLPEFRQGFSDYAAMIADGSVEEFRVEERKGTLFGIFKKASIGHEKEIASKIFSQDLSRRWQLEKLMEQLRSNKETVVLLRDRVLGVFVVPSP